MKDHEAAPSSDAEALLRRWIGLDPLTIGKSAIRRAVRARMVSLAVDDVATYVRRVEVDSGERDRLVEEVVVPESWFFRDVQVYEQVRRFVAARIAGTQRGERVRILSAPCAAGEEPYSIAMSLLEAGHSPTIFRIDAIDVSHVALAKALAGRFSPNAFRNADSTYRDRWFSVDSRGAVIDESVRKCVNFNWANILEPARLEETLGAGRGSFDIVFCRNLLIYLTPVARTAVGRTIDRLLHPDGIVVVGAAEPAILGSSWTAWSPDSTFVLRRSSAAVTAPGMPAARGGRPRSAEPGPEPSPTGPLERATGIPTPLPIAEPHRLDSVPIDSGSDDARCPAQRSPAEMPAMTTLDGVMSAANALANERRFNEAIAVCEAYQATTRPDPELFFMMGMIHQTNGSHQRAEECFQRVLYLDAGHEEALLALSLLADERGARDLAEQYRQSARRALERKASP